MKHLFFLPLLVTFSLLGTIASAQENQIKKTSVKSKVKAQNVKMKIKGDLEEVALPYPVSYSSKFVTGNPFYPKMVLDMWKDFDENTFDRNAGLYADTVVMRLANGMTLRGYKDVMETAKAYRGTLAAVESKIDAVMSVNSVDTDEDWVLVWGSSKETDKTGKTKEMILHEAWKINKDGKVAQMLQYAVSEMPTGQK